MTTSKLSSNHFFYLCVHSVELLSTSCFVIPTSCSLSDGQDFAGGVFTLTFTPGSRSATAMIRVFNDSSLEGLEEFTVVLKDPGDPSVTIGADDTANITIRDDLSE